MIELDKRNFREVVGTPRIVLVACWATGCEECRRFEPTYAEIADLYPEHVFARMNVLTDDRLGEFFEIEHLPALMLYRDGQLLLKQAGAFTGEQLEDIVEQTESLDMDRVRAANTEREES